MKLSYLQQDIFENSFNFEFTFCEKIAISIPQAEMNALKREISQHRAFLLEHRNCPAMTGDALQYLMSTSQW
jgi:hypothetical protein